MTIEQVWQKYDINYDGGLDHQEATKFLEATFKKMQIDNKNLVQDFLANDKSGKIEKEELVSFIKKVTAQNNDIEAGNGNGNGKGDQSTEKLIDKKQGEFD